MLLLIWKNYLDKPVEIVSSLMERKPFLFLTAVIGLFVLFAVFLRVNIPLLGDSFVLLNNYEFTFSGDHELYLHRSPLSFFYFYIIASLLNVTSYPALMDAFLVGELLLGGGFIVNTFFTVKHLFEEPKARLVIFCFLLTLPYMQLFFGYVELYSVVLFALSLFTLVSVLSMKKILPFYFVPPAFLFLLTSNYLNVILSFALLFVTVQEFRNGKKWTIPVGYLLCGVFIVVVFALVGFDVQRFFSAAEHSHWLSLTHDKGDEFQAYGLFSPFHVLDLVNLFVMLGASATFLFAVGLMKERLNIFKSEINIFFLSAIIPVLGFIALVKFDLGFPKDWDVPAPYFFLFNLFALLIFFQTEYLNKITIVALFTIVSLLTSMPWFLVNANAEATLQRTEALIDSRITSPSGMYQSQFHRSMYYHKHKMLDKQIDVWTRYTTNVPNDWRGLKNLAKSYYEGGPTYDSLTTAAFEQWVKTDSLKNDGTIEYANFLSERGLLNYRVGKKEIAEMQFRKAIALNRELVAAYNNLGILYLDMQLPDSTIVFCRKAVNIKPDYVLAFQNMANAFAQKNAFDSAIVYYQRVISIDSKYVNAYENMSRAYYQKGNQIQALVFLKQAARMGSMSAQYVLRASGESW
ncbi:MAG: tetratricopeptide repeat protein [Ignavibacteriae bacterium]|nr:tetratricopeptide repeat protein [Ignavibacteriota bacterium]